MKTFRNMSFMVIMLGLVLILTVPVMAQTMSDSGLQNPFHIAVGPYTASSSSDNSSGSGIAVKADYTFFRPTRHEALASIWYGNSSGTGWVGGTAEYHWRFGGHGIAYYGLGGGFMTNTGSNGVNGGAFTSCLGVDLGHFTLESRSLAVNSDLASMFMIGYRF